MPDARRIAALLALAAALSSFCAGSGFAGAASPAAERLPAARPAVTALGRLPLHFEPNQGQAPSEAVFVSRGSGYALTLGRTEAVLSLRGPGVPSNLRMRFVGASEAPQIAGEDRRTGTVSYLRGKEPAAWRSGVPTYGAVRYRQLYPGIDLVFYGSQGQLEFDFAVAPGADPEAIALAFEGADRLTLEPGGDLAVTTTRGVVRLRKPVVYQERDGRQHPVPGDFVLAGAGQVGFRLAAYDRTRPLVIDPQLAFSTYLGGLGIEKGAAIALDAAGNIYVAGGTDSPDFPATPGAAGIAPGSGDGDAFVAKLTPDGSMLVYATYLGGSSFDEALGLAVDGYGNAIVTGITSSTDFPTVHAIKSDKSACAPSPPSPCTDIFVAKLNASGSALVYSTYFGGGAIPGDLETGYGVAVDGAGNAYVAGAAASDVGLVTTHLHPTARGGALVLKLGPDGSLGYATDFGRGTGRGIAVDGSGSAYVTGGTSGADFPVTPGALP